MTNYLVPFAKSLSDFTERSSRSRVLPLAEVSDIRPVPANCRPRESGRQAKKVEHDAAKDWRNVPVVLIVEDEILLRLQAREVIEDGGFDVLEAKNADDAISILEQRNDVVLIFTDINMPGSMDGLKLTHFVKDRWPPIKISATSGHAMITADDLPRRQPLCSETVPATEIADAIHQLVRP